MNKREITGIVFITTIFMFVVKMGSDNLPWSIVLYPILGFIIIFALVFLMRLFFKTNNKENK